MQQRRKKEAEKLARHKSLKNLADVFVYFREHKPQEKKIVAGGFTNETALVKTVSGHLFACRKPGKQTSQYIDRQAEKDNTKIAYEAGVTPVVVEDHGDGYKITNWLQDAMPMNKMALKNPVHLKKVTDVLRQLHTCGKQFANSSDMFERIKKFTAIIKSRDEAEFKRYENSNAAKTIKEIEALIRKLNIPAVPCHNDDTPGNFLLSNGKMYLIDFEYGGNNDPVCDLACLSMEAEFPEILEDFMLCAYYGKDLTESIVQRFYLYQPVIEFYAGLWCRVQLVNGNVDNIPDMEAWEKKRLNNCNALMGGKRFQDTLAAVKADKKEVAANNTEAANTVEQEDDDVAKPGCCGLFRR